MVATATPIPTRDSRDRNFMLRRLDRPKFRRLRCSLASASAPVRVRTVPLIEMSSSLSPPTTRSAVQHAAGSKVCPGQHGMDRSYTERSCRAVLRVFHHAVSVSS